MLSVPKIRSNRRALPSDELCPMGCCFALLVADLRHEKIENCSGKNNPTSLVRGRPGELLGIEDLPGAESYSSRQKAGLAPNYDSLLARFVLCNDLCRS